MASQLATILLFPLALLGCDATDPIANPYVGGDLPDSTSFTRANPVTFEEIEGPTFYTFYNPDIVSDDGVLWHSHKNCPGTPRNYSFPVSEPKELRDDLRRVTMACQYKFN